MRRRNAYSGSGSSALMVDLNRRDKSNFKDEWPKVRLSKSRQAKFKNTICWNCDKGNLNKAPKKNSNGKDEDDELICCKDNIVE